MDITIYEKNVLYLRLHHYLNVGKMSRITSYNVCYTKLLRMGFVVGLISGLISFIPYVGCVTGFLVSMAIALAQFTTPAPIIAVAVVFAIGQFLEGNFLTSYNFV